MLKEPRTKGLQKNNRYEPARKTIAALLWPSAATFGPRLCKCTIKICFTYATGVLLALGIRTRDSKSRNNRRGAIRRRSLQKPQPITTTFRSGQSSTLDVLYQDKQASGEESAFFKLISREIAEERDKDWTEGPWRQGYAWPTTCRLVPREGGEVGRRRIPAAPVLLAGSGSPCSLHAHFVITPDGLSSRGYL